MKVYMIYESWKEPSTVRQHSDRDALTTLLNIMLRDRCTCSYLYLHESCWKSKIYSCRLAGKRVITGIWFTDCHLTRLRIFSCLIRKADESRVNLVFIDSWYEFLCFFLLQFLREENNGYRIYWFWNEIIEEMEAMDLYSLTQKFSSIFIYIHGVTNRRQT